MNLLALDTSTDQPVLGLSMGVGVFLGSSPSGVRRHGRDLIPRLKELFETAGLRADDLELVAVGIGPGSYTGLRIGLTAAKTLCYATGAALIGLDSLEIWACTSSAAPGRIHVVADAQRGDVYAAEFLRVDSHEPPQVVTQSHVEPLAAWARRLQPPGLVLGPGLESAAIRSALPADLAIAAPVPVEVRTSAALGLAARLWSAGRRDDLWTLEPNYLRRSAAEDQWEARITNHK
jgi:tRNA threonylcarbamoyladenosine biosynthesis protein TsaB